MKKVYNALRKVPNISDEEAFDMAEMIGTTTDMATKADLQELAATTKADIQKLAVATKADIQKLAVATKADIQNLATATKEDLRKLEMATKADIQKLAAEFTLMRKDLESLEGRMVTKDFLLHHTYIAIGILATFIALLEFFGR